MISLRPPRRGHAWGPISLVVLPACFFGLHQATPLRLEHYFVLALLLGSAWSTWGRRFSLVLAPLTAAGFGYELFPLLARFRGTIRVAELWNWEHLLFPVPGAPGVAVSDLLSSFSLVPLDLLSGVTYLTHLPEAMGLAVLFFFLGDVRRAQRLAVGFFLLNVLGWCLWLAYPAAPPWYVDKYGLGSVELLAQASPAGGARFDALLGQPFFSELYSRSTNVFGAFPSLHVGYAAIAAMAGFHSRPAIRWFTLSYAVLMAFSALYLRHHYLVDVVGGITCAFLAYGLAGTLLQTRGGEVEAGAANTPSVGELA